MFYFYSVVTRVLPVHGCMHGVAFDRECAVIKIGSLVARVTIYIYIFTKQLAKQPHLSAATSYLCPGGDAACVGASNQSSSSGSCKAPPSLHQAGGHFFVFSTNGPALKKQKEPAYTDSLRPMDAFLLEFSPGFDIFSAHYEQVLLQFCHEVRAHGPRSILSFKL
jgi:hypothetical protein